MSSFKIPKITQEMIHKANQDAKNKIRILQDERIKKLRDKEQQKLEKKLLNAEKRIRECKPIKQVSRYKSNASKEAHITRKKRIVLHYLARDLTIDEARKMANLSKFDFKKMIKDDVQFAQECRCTRLVELESYLDEIIGQTMEQDHSLIDTKKYSDYVAEKKLRTTAQIEKVKYLKEELKHERTIDLLDKQYKDLDISVEI